jgi:hypothetical protein
MSVAIPLLPHMPSWRGRGRLSFSVTKLQIPTSYLSTVRIYFYKTDVKMLCAFLWVIHRRLKFICHEFGALCMFWLKMEQIVFRNVGI